MCINLRARAQQAVKYAEIAAHCHPLCSAFAVERVCIPDDILVGAEEGIAQALCGWAWAIVRREVDGHGGVECGESEDGLYVAVQHCDVAVAHNPFVVLRKAGEVEPVYDAHGTVAAAGADDGRYRGVVKQALHQSSAVSIAPSQLPVALVEPIGHHYLQPPRFECRYCWRHILGAHGTRRCCYGHTVARL